MELILPDARYLPSYRAAALEFRRRQVTDYHFLDENDGDILARIADFRLGRNLPEGFVPATYLWLVDGGEFLAEASLRHQLTPNLERLGGHIGYGVRLGAQGRGMGTLLLRQTLTYAREVVGLSQVLLTCSEANLASARVIEKNGGVLADKIAVGERITCRYWIALADID